MQVRFRYTDREYLHSRRINKLLGMPKWKSLGLAFICLLPSVVLVTFTFSFIALIAFALVAAYLIVMICLALIKQPTLSDKHDHVMTFTPLSMHEKSSHSEYELCWQSFDEFTENETEFLLRRLERFISLPKRIFTQPQSDQLRTLAAKTGGTPEENAPPISLFARIFSQPDRDRIYQFTYRPEDLVQAATDRLVIVDTTQLEKPRKKPAGSWMAVIWLTTFVLVGFYLVRAPGGPDSQWTPNQYLVLGGTLILPFVLLLGFSRIIRARTARRLPQVPRDENSLVLIKQGFAVGTPGNLTFYDWRDIDAFYENGSCYGFKSFNDLIQVIPKRIFADARESAAFLNQAINLHREYRRSFEVPAAVVETGNPYQPPAN
jgi:hypothetical protein